MVATAEFEPTAAGPETRTGSSPVAAGQSTPERISQLSTDLARCIAASGTEIEQINLQTRLLSFNAQIEAARAGTAGVAFAVVGQEMVSLSHRTAEAADRLRTDSQGLVGELTAISRSLSSDVRGTRLADLALVNIDLIDRNLYERSCDCRWWATDDAMVNALAAPSPAAAQHASARMAVILKAYTVYFDIVLADREGRIIANGRPDRYRSVGTNHATAPWFRSALECATGDEFGFQSAHRSPLAGNERVLVYSCKVCRGGQAAAEAVGVLGVVFRWDALADTIVRQTPVDESDRSRTRACIVAPDGTLLADSAGRALEQKLDLPDRAGLFALKKGHREIQLGGHRTVIGIARSPGFETYATGWHSVVLQALE
ncbi:MAG TPA: methyl-accepting chemotaxis protein [Lacunisphaera sp.]|nr:methyl-accepting chemotaxis protein [Lacunisphaera sp.]